MSTLLTDIKSLYRPRLLCQKTRNFFLLQYNKYTDKIEKVTENNRAGVTKSIYQKV